MIKMYEMMSICLAHYRDHVNIVILIHYGDIRDLGDSFWDTCPRTIFNITEIAKDCPRTIFNITEIAKDRPRTIFNITEISKDRPRTISLNDWPPNDIDV